MEPPKPPPLNEEALRIPVPRSVPEDDEDDSGDKIILLSYISIAVMVAALLPLSYWIALKIYNRLVHLSLTSKFFNEHLKCGALDLPDPSLSFKSAIALSSTSRVAHDGWPG